jgi:hypothetical protein
MLEMSISLGLLVVLMSAVGQVILAGSRAFRTGSAEEALTMKARRTLDRIADELEMAGVSTLFPVPAAPFGSSSLRLRTPTGLVNNVVVYGNRTRIALVPDPADPLNGVDDDGDGLVDEEFVQITKDVGLPSQRTVTLAENACPYLQGEVLDGADGNGNGLIDERGLSFVLVNKQLTVRLTLQGVDQGRRPITCTVQTTVKIRN